MRALVVYESMYGNTRRVAEAIAEGLGRSMEVVVREAEHAAGVAADLVVVGAPTHGFTMPTDDSRRSAELQTEDPASGLALDEDAESPGVREWIEALPEGRQAFAAFDTRLNIARLLTGAASGRIAKRLDRKGWREAMPPESFLVDRENRLVDGEEERARAWGEELAAAFGATR